MREAATGYRVANGALEIDTGADEVDGTAPNLIGQPVPGRRAGRPRPRSTSPRPSRASRPACCSTRSRRTGSRSCWSTRAPRARSSSCASRTAPTSSTRRSRSTSRRRSPASTCGCAPTARSGQAASTRPTAPTWTDVGKSRDISDLGAGYLGPLALRGGAATPVTAKFDYVRVRSRHPSPPARPTARPRPASSASGTASTSPARPRPARAASTSSTTAPRAAGW